MKSIRITKRMASIAWLMSSASLPVFAQQNAAPSQIGDSTRSLLALQSSGKVAAPVHPMLGDEATAAYARYINSFSHPIPAQFGSSVGDIGGSGSGSSGGASN